MPRYQGPWWMLDLAVDAAQGNGLPEDLQASSRKGGELLCNCCCHPGSAAGPAMRHAPALAQPERPGWRPACTAVSSSLS